jgi:hypothetical protein
MLTREEKNRVALLQGTLDLLVMAAARLAIAIPVSWGWGDTTRV